LFGFADTFQRYASAVLTVIAKEAGVSGDIECSSKTASEFGIPD